jgi:hypothetical protein
MKHHIFIGSTADDVKNERKELLRIVMELGHIPVVADYLDGAARNAEKLLEKTIEDCDYFIALIAHKHHDKDGRVLPLAKEHALAVKHGVQVLGLIIDDKARWKPVKMEKNPALISEMNEFKIKLQNSPCELWLNTPDLCQKALSLLVKEQSINARPGWERTDMTIESRVANELSRLSSENSALRRQYTAEYRETDDKLQEELEHIIKVLSLNRISLSFYYATGENWENTRQFRLIRLFKILVPELIIGKTTAEISRFVGTVLNPDLQKAIRKEYPTPSNTIRKIMADFSAMNLVRCTNNGEAKRADEVWEITGHGKNVFAVYRKRQFEKALAKRSE